MVEEALKKSLSQRITGIPGKIRKNWLSIVIIIVWSLLISFLIVREWTNFVVTNPYYKWYATHSMVTPAFETWEGAGLSSIDIMVILVASLVFGAFFRDVNKLIAAAVSTIVISTSLSTGYVAYYIWTNLGWGHVLIYLNGGWSWAVYWGFLDVFREMGIVFLLAPFCAFVGAFVGYALGGS